jgi:hypothetical protein
MAEARMGKASHRSAARTTARELAHQIERLLVTVVDLLGDCVAVGL